MKQWLEAAPMLPQNVIPSLTIGSRRAILGNPHIRILEAEQMGKALALETLWKARQMYEERWTEEEAKGYPAVAVRVGERKWSYRSIAQHLGISETSVLRAVTNTGRLANRNNMPLPETKTDEELKEGAAASLQKLLGMIAEEKKETTPGQTTADNLLNEFENLKRKPDGNG